MQIRELYEGHYRSLEPEFLRLASELSTGDTALRIVSAGAGQLSRLRELLLLGKEASVTGGTEFLPGMPHLLRKLSSIPIELQKVSGADRALFALKAMETLVPKEPLYELAGNAETASSMAGFFEELLDQGITPSSYLTILDMLKGDPAITVKVVGRVFTIYSQLRRKAYPFATIEELLTLLPEDVSGPFLFYGYYDLNPAQRSVVRRLNSFPGAEIYWFSPVGEHSPWSHIYSRTRGFLESQGIASIVRCGGGRSMGRFAAFFEALPEQARPAPPMPGFRITSVSGSMGVAREVLHRVAELRDEGVEGRQIAVVSRSGAEDVIRMAHHEEVPVAEPLTAGALQMPYGRLMSAVIELEENDFHYSSLERTGASGALGGEYAFDPSHVSKVVLTTGIRMGMERWQDWFAADSSTHQGLARFVRELCDFYAGLPARAPAAVYAGRLEGLFRRICRSDLKEAFLDQLFDERRYRAPGDIGWKRFAQTFRIECRTLKVELRDGSSDGFLVLKPEKTRGSLFHTVILLDMEEGSWPAVPVDDPRLPDDLRRKLELSLKSDREREDGFLLRQIGESAQENLELVYMHSDSDGREVYPSPFIAPMVISDSGYSPSSEWFFRPSSSPAVQLIGGSNPGQIDARKAAEGQTPTGAGFLTGILAGESARLSDSPFDEWDGVIGGSDFMAGPISASRLEQYVRCPFAFLAKERWKARDRSYHGVSALPEPTIAGRIVHDAVEALLGAEGFMPDKDAVLRELSEAAGGYGLEALLGSGDLEDLWFRRQVSVIQKSLRNLSVHQWAFEEAELSLEGAIGSVQIDGRLDLLLRDPEGCLVVIDLKTGKARPNRETEKGKLYQLPFYYSLLGHSRPDREISFLGYASISEGQPGKVLGFTGQEMEEMMPEVTIRVERLVELIRQGFFPPCPQEKYTCAGCGFRHLCRRTPEERIGRKLAADPRLGILREL